MPLKRIHVLGASGSGTTTLGHALAKHYSLPFIDSDDIFWEKTDPPYTVKNADREAHLAAALGEVDWVLSGSSMGWGDFLRTRFTHLIFLTLDPAVRLSRLRTREKARHGACIAEGGNLHRQNQEFLAWAAGYDGETFKGRSLIIHEKWLRDLPCPVLRLGGTLATTEQVSAFEKFLAPIPFSVESCTHPAPHVDTFYENSGRSARARPGDVLLVAIDEGGEILGCVRYCVEEGTPMLRSMLVAERARKRGVGAALLAQFDSFLREQKVAGIYCVPFTHLESFYASIGFKRVENGPKFLLARLDEYRHAGQSALLMFRV
jgi:adenylate kinase family enzyme/N-acetylglutamate synthase-like GNAT family acetyltransferase